MGQPGAVSPQSLQRERVLQGPGFQASGLQNPERMNFCSFTPLSLWSFVMPTLGNKHTYHLGYFASFCIKWRIILKKERERFPFLILAPWNSGVSSILDSDPGGYTNSLPGQHPVHLSLCKSQQLLLPGVKAFWCARWHTCSGALTRALAAQAERAWQPGHGRKLLPLGTHWPAGGERGERGGRPSPTAVLRCRWPHGLTKTPTLSTQRCLLRSCGRHGAPCLQAAPLLTCLFPFLFHSPSLGLQLLTKNSCASFCPRLHVLGNLG